MVGLKSASTTSRKPDCSPDNAANSEEDPLGNVCVPHSSLLTTNLKELLFSGLMGRVLNEAPALTDTPFYITGGAFQSPESWAWFYLTAFPNNQHMT